MEVTEKNIQKFQLAARRLALVEHTAERHASSPHKGTKAWHLEQAYYLTKLKSAREVMAAFPEEWTNLYPAETVSTPSAGGDASRYF